MLIAFSFVSSVIGGAGNGINSSSAVALLNSYEDKRQEYMNYFNVVSGVGVLYLPNVHNRNIFLFPNSDLHVPHQRIG
jgi:hypothetical protein